MRLRGGILAIAALVRVALAAAPTNAELKEEVRKMEHAFARTMADRNHGAFASFLAPDAVFMNGPRALRGAKEVAEGWKRFFESPAAPFSWEPEIVEVLDSGKLALSSGPVRNPAGRRVGTFNSVWRREKNGKWRIVLDNGCPPCNCQEAGK